MAVRVSEIVVPELLVPPLTPVCATVQAKVVPGVKLVKAIEGAVPEHIVWEAGVAIANGTGFTVTATDTQVVVLHAPCARTKYVVLAVGDTESVAPEPTRVPPQDPVYHFQLAPVPRDPPATLSVVAPPQVVAGLALAEVGATDGVLIVTVT